LRPLDLVDSLGQRPRAAALEHAQPARTTDSAHQRRGRDPTPHRGELDRDAAADELGERGLEHCYATPAVVARLRSTISRSLFTVASSGQLRILALLDLAAPQSTV
jgi:hypothetical protein